MILSRWTWPKSKNKTEFEMSVDPLQSCIGFRNAIDPITFGFKFIALVVTREWTESEWDSYTVCMIQCIPLDSSTVGITLDSYTGRGHPMSPVQPECDIRKSHADVSLCI